MVSKRDWTIIISSKYLTQWIKKSFQKPRAYISKSVPLFWLHLLCPQTLGNPDSRCLLNFGESKTNEVEVGCSGSSPAGWHPKCPSANQINHNMHKGDDDSCDWKERQTLSIASCRCSFASTNNCKIVLGQQAMTIWWDAMILNKNTIKKGLGTTPLYIQLN